MGASDRSSTSTSCPVTALLNTMSRNEEYSTVIPRAIEECQARASVVVDLSLLSPTHPRLGLIALTESPAQSEDTGWGSTFLVMCFNPAKSSFLFLGQLASSAPFHLRDLNREQGKSGGSTVWYSRSYCTSTYSINRPIMPFR
jgi:hypothetical protein